MCEDGVLNLGYGTSTGGCGCVGVGYALEMGGWFDMGLLFSGPCWAVYTSC